MILLDTHVLLWLRFGSQRLGSTTRDLIGVSWQVGDAYVSSISFWEVALLVSKRRLELDESVDRWRRIVIEEGIKEIPVNSKIAVRAVELNGLHADPADRIIVSTALDGYQLLTVDRRMLNWRGDLDRFDATH